MENEFLVHPNRRLGRRSPSRKPALRLGNFLTGVIPQYPLTADRFSSVKDWGLYGNDRYGDCGPVSVANSRKLVSLYLTGNEQSPTQDDVFDLYRRSGNPNFDPNTDADDNGVDMQTMLEAVNSGGISGVKALGFARVQGIYEIRAAIAIFGFVLLGVDLETSQQTQTDHGLWDYQPSNDWGGHAVLCGQYTSSTEASLDRTSVVTWAEIVKMTDAFVQRQVDEAWVVIWPEHLQSKTFLEGVDLATLAADYKALTDREFPAQVPPQPTPAPTPNPAPAPDPTPDIHADSADIELAGKLKRWVHERHILDNHMAQRAVKNWASKKGITL
jgi:hypothetical protein